MLAQRNHWYNHQIKDEYFHTSVFLVCFPFMYGDASRAFDWTMMCLISTLYHKEDDCGRYQYLWWGYNFVITLTYKF